MKYIIFFFLTLITITDVFAKGNEFNESFSKSKQILKNEVYYDNKLTFYCEALFDNDGNIFQNSDFLISKFKNRNSTIEWEHIVPAENFGRSFSEWRDGHPECRNKYGKSFRGRKCARKLNREFRLMESDMYNLVPAIGSINALRSNYNFDFVSDSEYEVCRMKIGNGKIEPHERIRGFIARTYLYMDKEYKQFKMSRKTKKLMLSWDKLYPVTEWECIRAKRIERVQGNRNVFVIN